MEDDKFILMGLNDERSKKIAEVLGNKTCKVIVDHLADVKEASEKDISDALDVPINTVEYNLKKLLDTGLVKKSKNFFWSQKGRKIPMYRLANKHIIISPRKPSLSYLKSIIPVVLVAALAIIFLAFVFQPILEDKGLKTFESQAELDKFLKSMEPGIFERFFDMGSFVEPIVLEAIDVAFAAESEGAEDYSETNIQVSGVDEPDIVKSDGKYIYAVSGGTVFIVDAFPAEDMKLLSELNVSGVNNIFINGNRLVVFSQDFKGRTSETLVQIYDVSDRESPELEDEVSVSGRYSDARMIGNTVYVVSTQHTGFGDTILPYLEHDGIVDKVEATEIGYFDYPDTSYSFTSILAMNIESGDFESETYLMGSGHTLYVSEENIYLTNLRHVRSDAYFDRLVDEVMKPLLPRSERAKIKEIMDSDKSFSEKSREVQKVVQDYSDTLVGDEKAEFDGALAEALDQFLKDLAKDIEKTIIHKIGIDALDIEYLTSGEVPGRVLNQFSMDEFDGNFRIATTTGDNWRSNTLNHMYVLDEDLEIIGSVSDLAEGERIYSARFVGERAYMVTFRQVDPLFVIDLSNPKSPEVLGELKITGFSSYLHPYDENHIIGVGKEATETGRALGVKIALFDVSDVSNPIEIAKYEVEEKGSNSNALYDHKAFLFDRERNLLVLPMTYTLDIESGDAFGRYRYWQGAFVFDISLDGIDLKGKIDHKSDSEEQLYYYGPYAVQRSLYMDNILYTISRAMIKANDLSDLDEINRVELPNKEEKYYGFIDGPIVVN